MHKAELRVEDRLYRYLYLQWGEVSPLAIVNAIEIVPDIELAQT